MVKSEVEKPASSSKSKKERLLFPTKVVIRRLPPSFTEDQLKEELGGFPEHDFFYFVGSEMSFGPLSFSRAYINFKNRDDIIKFRDQFDGYCFVDSRGVEYHAVVEYAPYQGIPKKKAKKDPKVATILEDPDYLAFLESLKEASEPPPSIESHLEEIQAKKSSSSATKISTPLLEYIKMKRSSRGRPVSARGTPEKKRRPEREELSKSPKKGSASTLSSNKDTKGSSGQQSPKEEKPKDDRKDAKNKEEGHRKDELDKKGTRDTRAAPPSKDKLDSKSPPKGKEEKGRSDSGRYGRRSDNRRSDDRRSEDRRAGNQRDRRDNTDSSGHDRGRDERYRKESGSESGRRDRRPDSRRDSRPESKPKDREPLPKASDSDKGIKPGREQEREHGGATVKEKEKKDTESSAVANESKPPAEEARGPPKVEKKRSESERRVRNKDRPDRAIYQPRSAGRGGPRADAPKTAEEKDKSKESKTKEKSREPERDTRKNRDDRTRDRDRDRYRDDRRERDRDRRSDRDRDRERPREKTRDREPVSDRVRDTGYSKEEWDDKGKGESNGTRKTNE